MTTIGDALNGVLLPIGGITVVWVAYMVATTVVAFKRLRIEQELLLRQRTTERYVRDLWINWIRGGKR